MSSYHATHRKSTTAVLLILIVDPILPTSRESRGSDGVERELFPVPWLRLGGVVLHSAVIALKFIKLFKAIEETSILTHTSSNSEMSCETKLNPRKAL